MTSFVVTNIRLPEDDYLRLKTEAAMKRKSLSAVIREKVGKKLPPEEYAKRLLTLKTSWFTDKDYKNYKEMRAELKERAKMYDW